MRRQCFDCRRQLASGLQPEMSPLPTLRFPKDKPFVFQQTGLDLFGPFASRTAGQYNKRYGVIFTCLTSRAVHLEMCQDLSADAFINTLRRFVSRRGTPQQIISDNGRNFTATEKELSKNFRATKTMDFYASQNIDRKFNPPTSTPLWRSLGTTNSICQRRLLRSNWKPDTQRRHIQHSSL